MVLVVAHVDVVLAKLVPLVPRNPLAHLAVEHREAVVHARGLVLLVKTALRAALHIFQFLREFHHHGRGELARVFHLIVHWDTRFLRLLWTARFAGPAAGG